ncbi:MAG TPA: hypothetical protein VFK89_05955 [Actinomycetota bacterium]|nr:hypothetical protein [Actinomycetota bacterium]
MTKRPMLVAAILWAAYVVTLVWALYVGSRPETGDPISVTDAIWACSLIGFPTAGFLIAGKIPRNPLGWVLLATSLLFMFGVGAADYAQILAQRGDVGAAQVWALLPSATNPIAMCVAILIPLLIPDGRLPARWWRAGTLVVALVVSFWLFRNLFVQNPFEDIAPRLANPLASTALSPIADALNQPAAIAYDVLFVAALASLVFRYRRARGIERQQLRWVAFGAVVVVLCFLIAGLMGSLGVGENNVLNIVIIVIAQVALPVALAVAMLRYRLFEIGRLVNRTIVYGAITAILAGTYIGIVFVLQGVLGSVTKESDLAVAASTLAVAALFRPLRGRVQAFVDRRFYRRKFDAQRTLEEFSGRLRDEVELSSVSSGLLSVVEDTMQPAHVSLWLRTSEGNS